MADLSITAANVLSGSGATIANGTAGASITAGQTLYLDATTNTWKLADANNTALTADVGGIALHAALTGQPIAVQTAGTITIGATVAVGTIYVLSATPGGIAPSTDLATGWFTSVLGVATTTTAIALRLNKSGVAVP